LNTFLQFELRLCDCCTRLFLLPKDPNRCRMSLLVGRVKAPLPFPHYAHARSAVPAHRLLDTLHSHILRAFLFLLCPDSLFVAVLYGVWKELQECGFLLRDIRRITFGLLLADGLGHLRDRL